MKESVITVNFDVESEAYQALSEIKRHPDGSGYFVSAASLIKKENGHIVLKDGFDTGVDTADDAAYGSLIGSLVGLLGGPLGVLFGGSMGALVGSTVDADDAMQSASLIEQVCTDIRDGGTALIALVQEDDDMRFERAFDPFSVFTKLLGDKYFTRRSINDIIQDYRTNYPSEKDKNGKKLYKMICSNLEDVGINKGQFIQYLCEDICQYENFESFIGTLRRMLS